MPSIEQLTAQLEYERSQLKSLEKQMRELINACERVNPIIESAIGGLNNAGVAVTSYHMALGLARLELKSIEESRAARARAGR